MAWARRGTAHKPMAPTKTRTHHAVFPAPIRPSDGVAGLTCGGWHGHGDWEEEERPFLCRGLVFAPTPTHSLPLTNPPPLSPHLPSTDTPPSSWATPSSAAQPTATPPPPAARTPPSPCSAHASTPFLVSAPTATATAPCSCPSCGGWPPAVRLSGVATAAASPIRPPRRARGRRAPRAGRRGSPARPRPVCRAVGGEGGCAWSRGWGRPLHGGHRGRA